MILIFYFYNIPKKKNQIQKFNTKKLIQDSIQLYKYSNTIKEYKYIIQ